jgi:hypothetical protein
MTLEISGKYVELPTMTIELPIFGTTPVRRTIAERKGVFSKECSLLVVCRVNQT